MPTITVIRASSNFARHAGRSKNQNMQIAPAAMPSSPATIPMDAIQVEHAAFPTVVLADPIDWAINPYNSPAWLHHFMSLRWIPADFEADLLFQIVKSFYQFHCAKKSRNPYYTHLRGDHAAVIRIEQLLTFRERFSELNNVPAQGICDRIIRAEAVNLQRDAMYRAGHNHGLMTDIMLLTLWNDYPAYRGSIDPVMIAARGQATLDEMFTRDGITREHSISYQEHNYPLAVQFLDLHPDHNAALIKKRKATFAENTKKILSFALRDSGDYLAIGDTLRSPNKNIRASHPEIVANENELATLGSKGYRLYCDTGLFFYKRRKSVDDSFKKNIHFSATCGWNSVNHKQDDELSFCLEIDGELVFDDPGYTVNVVPRDRAIRTASAHSTIEIAESPFCDIRDSARGSRIAAWFETTNGFVVNMAHDRVADHAISREISLYGEYLTIRDKILRTNFRNPLLAFHNFVLHPDIQAEVSGLKVKLYKGNTVVAEIEAVEGNGSWTSENLDYIGIDKYLYLITKKMVFKSSQEFCEFKIEF